MNMLSVVNDTEIQDKMNKFALDNRISQDEVICSIVYEFAKNLPYSIDYKDPKFVPGIFLNVGPVNPSKWIFKDYDNLYNKMINWGDTLKSGILLEICFILQRMLIGEFPSDYHFTDDDYYNLGVNQMTHDEEYNLYLFETIQQLPEYCRKVNSVDVCDRRKILDEIYIMLLDRIGQKIGGFRRTNIEGDLISIQEYKPTIRLFPHRDLDMLYYFNHINYGYGVSKLINDINKCFNVDVCKSNENLIVNKKVKIK